MQSKKSCFEYRLETYNWDHNPMWSKSDRKKRHSAAPLFSSHRPLYPSLKRKPQTRQDDTDSQVKYNLSLINDPLWKKVCCHVENMMGPLSVDKIWECRLGVFSSKEKDIDIYCQTKESAQFLKQYAFVVLGELKQYFPALQKLKVNFII